MDNKFLNKHEYNGFPLMPLQLKTHLWLMKTILFSPSFFYTQLMLRTSLKMCYSTDNADIFLIDWLGRIETSSRYYLILDKIRCNFGYCEINKLSARVMTTENFQPPKMYLVQKVLMAVYP